MKTATRPNNAYVKPMPFDSMSAAERRVAIAKDVIAGLKTERIEATEGVYVRSNFSCEEINTLGRVEMQSLFKAKMNTCRVCAKGALFVAMVEKFDRVKLLGYRVQGTNLHLCEDDIEDPLKAHFSDDQLDLIEDCFEGFNNRKANAPEFFRLYPDSIDRMVAIMKNIIKNNGEFVLK